MATGTVKWFNDSKGLVLLLRMAVKIYLRTSRQLICLIKTLKEGQKVSFDVTQGPKGKQASNIQST